MTLTSTNSCMKMGVFCFHCGILGHLSPDCSVLVSNRIKHKVDSVMEEGGHLADGLGDERSNVKTISDFSTADTGMDVNSDLSARCPNKEGDVSLLEVADECSELYGPWMAAPIKSHRKKSMAMSSHTSRRQRCIS